MHTAIMSIGIIMYRITVVPGRTTGLMQETTFGVKQDMGKEERTIRTAWNSRSAKGSGCQEKGRSPSSWKVRVE